MEPSKRQQRLDLREWERELAVSVKATDEYGTVDYEAPAPPSRSQKLGRLIDIVCGLDLTDHHILDDQTYPKKPRPLTNDYLPTKDPPYEEQGDGLTPA